ncbi:hypothetical protein GDO81_019875 [Engystomops pustulosus]|uniref:C3H1-type domain-containing protein n=1 Tax=Engystomops pustulosus TaxID=76066 RepID=A0AAV6Z162_ENGPU|nr:hypothetical protein GDO81_019875 [Engystomops pustulosus]KAG8540080.1 hypothetical protein GDO81_019875 [Engystomops pustulosus]KAG8540081.1 hypothetical protein GDO81_019875 [Engystomops pustulosus]
MMNFIADLSEMFPAGIYDTKYASEFETRFTASYLEYAYKKCKRENGKLMESSSRHLVVEFCHYSPAMSAYVEYRLCSLPDPTDPGTDTPNICERFSAYGWCPNGVKCAQSHNIDLIIEEDEKCKQEKKKRRRKRKKMSGTEVHTEMDSLPPSKLNSGVSLKGNDMEQGEIGETDSLMNNVDCHMEDDKDGSRNLLLSSATSSATSHQPEKTPLSQDCAPASASLATSSAEGGTHRAGFDAFMTGYIMAYVCLLKEKDSASCCLPDCINKIYLSGKNVPLQIAKSVFSKSSRGHAQKMRLISSVGS